MTTILTPDQLISALTSEQILAAQTDCVGGYQTNPITEEIQAAISRVEFYCAGWEVLANLKTDWGRNIAAWHVAKRLGSPTDALTAAKDRTLRELEDLRDGKFKGATKIATPLQPPNTNEAVTGAIAYGSQPNRL